MENVGEIELEAVAGEGGEREEIVGVAERTLESPCLSMSNHLNEDAKALTNASISSSWCMNNAGSDSKVQPSHICGSTARTWEWVGGNTTSTVAEWNLICDRNFLAVIPTSLFFIGTILGNQTLFSCNYNSMK
ncbi:hypothetical protein V6N13_128848 [Hibiscus sabdariffa]|uniref:Uncharacterized protein n=1 Tax=Hibiscus sabdariffa TaxID=183260 RepID=A0ABR2SJH6_9ROSI